MYLVDARETNQHFDSIALNTNILIRLALANTSRSRNTGNMPQFCRASLVEHFTMMQTLDKRSIA
jgi:hypothetical protein